MANIERNFNALMDEMSSTESLIYSLERQLTEANDKLVDLKDQKRFLFGNDNLYVNMESLLNKYDFDCDGVISIIDYYIWYGFNNNDSFVINNPKYSSNSKTFNGKSLEGIDLSKKMFNSFMNNVNKGIYKCVDNNIFKSYLNGKNADLIYKVIKGYWKALKVIPTLDQINNICITDSIDYILINNNTNTDELLPTETSNDNSNSNSESATYIINSNNGELWIDDVPSEEDIPNEIYYIWYNAPDGHRTYTPVFNVAFPVYKNNNYCGPKPDDKTFIYSRKSVVKRYRVIAHSQTNYLYIATDEEMAEAEKDAYFVDVTYAGWFATGINKSENYNGNMGSFDNALPEDLAEIVKQNSKYDYELKPGEDYPNSVVGFAYSRNGARFDITLWNADIYPEPPHIDGYEYLSSMWYFKIKTKQVKFKVMKEKLVETPNTQDPNGPSSYERDYEIISKTYHGEYMYCPKDDIDYNNSMGTFDNDINDSEIIIKTDEWNGLTYEEAWIKAPHVIQKLEYVNGKRKMIRYYKSSLRAISSFQNNTNANNYILSSTYQIFGEQYPYIFNIEYYYWKQISGFENYNEGIGENDTPTGYYDENEEYNYQLFNPQEFLERCAQTDNPYKGIVLYSTYINSLYGNDPEKMELFNTEMNDFINRNKDKWDSDSSTFENTYVFEGKTYYNPIPPCPGDEDDYELVSVMNEWWTEYYRWIPVSNSIYNSGIGNIDLPSDINILNIIDNAPKCSECGEILPESITIKGNLNFTDDPNYTGKEEIITTYYYKKPEKPNDGGDYFEECYMRKDTNGHEQPYYAWVNKKERLDQMSNYDNSIGDF